jgi:hypothetical protein
MRYILPFSVFVFSCVSALKREGKEFRNLVVILSRDGDGICALRGDTLDKVRISVISKGKEGEISFWSKVFMGEQGVVGWTIRDTIPISIFKVKFESSDTVELGLFDKKLVICFPECAQISEPKEINFPDWSNVKFSWSCNAKEYIVRLYAFTLMEQRDIVKVLKENSISFDLSSMYGDGFFALQVCPINSIRRGLKVFAVGGCTERVFLVGDTSVWEGERPDPPWRKDVFMWHLLEF